MKNEVLVRAITEIDEELIVSAHRSASSKRKSIKYFVAPAAACLLLICGVIFLFHKNGNKPDIAGSDIGIVFGDPVVSTQQSKIATFDLMQTSQLVITVTIEIDPEQALDITAADGEISVYSAETYKLIYVGQSYEVNEPVIAEWTIEDPDTDKTYRITVNNKEKVYMLRYDQTNGQWNITETEE